MSPDPSILADFEVQPHLQRRVHAEKVLPRRFLEEQEKIFGKVWTVVCHESEVRLDTRMPGETGSLIPF